MKERITATEVHLTTGSERIHWRTARERGIIFSGDNPKLIQEGRKTQTRRIIDPQPSPAFHTPYLTDVEGGKLSFKSSTGVHDDWRRCPYGVAGDRLWVRETWAAPTCYDDEKPRDLPDTLAENGEIIYRAESPDYRVKELGSFWRSPYHMPRWASRITLEVLKVRVGRLQDISEEDATAEGVESTFVNDDALHPKDGAIYWKNYIAGDQCKLTHAVDSYRTLWDSLHGKGAWDKNPWVWVLEFKLMRFGRTAGAR